MNASLSMDESRKKQGLRIDFKKVLSNEELQDLVLNQDLVVKKGPLPVAHNEGQYWVQDPAPLCNPLCYATIKVVDEKKLSATLVDRIGSLLVQRGIETGPRTSGDDHTSLYNPSPEPFLLDLRVIAFTNDINYAMKIKEGSRQLADIPYKFWIFTYKIPHIETGLLVEVQGVAKFQNQNANLSGLMEVLGTLGYSIER